MESTVIKRSVEGDALARPTKENEHATDHTSKVGSSEARRFSSLYLGTFV